MLSFLFRSEGAKRDIASVLSVVLGISSMFPGTEQIVIIVQWLASAFGVTGLLHAAKSQTILAHRIPSIVATLSALIAIAQFVPQLAPIIGPMQYLATILGAAAVGGKLSTK